MGLLSELDKLWYEFWNWQDRLALFFSSVSASFVEFTDLVRIRGLRISFNIDSGSASYWEMGSLLLFARILFIN